MKENKVNLISLSNINLSEVTISNVKFPEVVIIQSARKSSRYDSNGEPIQGSCGKITCNVIDCSIVKALEKIGADSSSLKTDILEFHGTEQNLLSIDIDELINSEIETGNIDVMLRWDQGRNGIGNGWRGLKMVLNIDNEDKIEEQK